MLRQLFNTAFITLGTLWTAGCATEDFRYVPTEHPAANPTQHDEAVYSEPPGEPTRTVRIVSQGISEIKDRTAVQDLKTLHLKMAISNRQPAGSLILDSRDQGVSFPNEAQVLPITGQPDPDGKSKLEIKPGELRTVDLYFLLPKNVNSSQDLPEFDFHWQLQVGSETIRKTTLFDRVRKPESPVAMVPYDPFYPFMGSGPLWYGGVRLP